MVDHRINAQRAVNSLEETTDPRNLSIGFEAVASAVLAVHDLLDERLPHAVSNETRATLDVSAQQRTVQEKATQVELSERAAAIWEQGHAAGLRNAHLGDAGDFESNPHEGGAS